MKKILASVFVITTIVLCAVSQAWAEITNTQRHGYWTSAIQTRGSDPSGPIMATVNMDDLSVLSLKFYPTEKQALIGIDIPNAAEFPGINKLDGKIVPSKVLVGHGKTLNVQFIYVSTGDSSMTLCLLPEFSTTIVREILQVDSSSSIIINVEGIQKIWEYPLNGFAEALERCLALVKVLK